MAAANFRVNVLPAEKLKDNSVMKMTLMVMKRNRGRDTKVETIDLEFLLVGKCLKCLI